MTATRRFGPAGTRLYGAVTDRWQLNEVEQELLGSACQHADMIARLEALLADSLETIGAVGQPKLNPAVAELRQARLALSRMLVDLALPPDVAETPPAAAPPVSFTARRASAAKVRHDRTRRQATRRGDPT